MEAECYQKIGKIQEKLGDMNEAIRYLEMFLELCEGEKNKTKMGEAHKQLAEAFSKNGNV